MRKTSLKIFLCNDDMLLFIYTLFNTKNKPFYFKFLKKILKKERKKLNESIIRTICVSLEIICLEVLAVLKWQLYAIINL